MLRGILVLGCLVAMLVCAVPAGAGEASPFLLRDDFGTDPLYDCYLSYYYYIPCPTTAWFWSWSAFEPGDILGAWFEVGDAPMGGGATCDPLTCFSLERFRFVEFTGYANYPRYPNLLEVQYDIYCADEYGCPVGPALWHNNTIQSTAGWTYVDFDPPLSLCACTTQPGAGGPRVLITFKNVGSSTDYLGWGFDNISTPLERSCAMHDLGCLPAVYPRPANSHYPTMHSGYYGNNGFEYCPPQGAPDGANTAGGEPYGYVEMAVRIYLSCSGPSEVAPMTWGKIKSLYR